MHIPDGYLGPITCGATFALMLPVWAIAARKVKEELNAKQVPLLAIGAAFSFVVMMFNVPIPGGTTGHAVGGALIAILLGPWAAVIAVSVALVIQALIFGDGGVLSIGANCFNMAFVLPFVGYGVYRVIASGSAATSTRRMVAAGIGGYTGLVAASFTAAIMFGLQPLLHRTASGQALYCPYGFSMTIPAMVGGHALVFGWVELFATSLVIKFIQMQEPSLLGRSERPENKLNGTTKLLIGLGVLALLSPLGLIIPGVFKAGDAWGEWSLETLHDKIGYIPSGMKKLSEFWQAPLPDYAFKGWENFDMKHLSFAYIISALTGMATIALIVWLVGRAIAKKGSKNVPS